MNITVGHTSIHCGPASLVARGLVTDRTVDRFMRKVAVSTDGCWIWQATISQWGYGNFNLSTNFGKKLGSHLAHNCSYRLFVGDVPKGFDVDHLCHTRECRLGRSCPHRACVRPSHLEAKPHAANLLRGASRWPGGACSKGHLWTPESTIFRTGGRTCRICWNDRARAAYADKTAGRPKKPHHNATKTHCPRDHEYTPENTIIRPNGSRACRECGRLATKRWNEKRERGG